MKRVSKTLSLAVLLSCSVLLSCEDDDRTEVYRMRINHFTQPAFPYYTNGNTFHFVQTGKDIGSNKWEMLGQTIHALDYELGYVYDIIVKRTDPDPNLADATPKYTVVSVIRQEKVTDDVTFTITLARGEPLAESYVTENEGAFKTVDGIAILCESFCDELPDKLGSLQTSEFLRGTFRHVDGETISLVDLEITGPLPNQD
ncbi:MAG: hypothetical protein U0U09_06210 [Cyclobacteriaceae bacterium]